MIAVNTLGAFGDTEECCNSCGTDMAGRHVCYWERSRVCVDCYEDLTEGERKIEAAKRTMADEYRRLEDDEQMKASSQWESNSLLSVLSAFALLGLLGLFWYLAVLGAVHVIGDMVDL